MFDQTSTKYLTIHLICAEWGAGGPGFKSPHDPACQQCGNACMWYAFKDCGRFFSCIHYNDETSVWSVLLSVNRIKLAQVTLLSFVKPETNSLLLTDLIFADWAAVEQMAIWTCKLPFAAIFQFRYIIRWFLKTSAKMFYEQVKSGTFSLTWLQ